MTLSLCYPWLKPWITPYTNKAILCLILTMFLDQLVGAAQSGDKIYCTNYDNSSQSIIGYQLGSIDSLFKKEVDGSFAVPKALNQYVICYYYDRMKM